MKAEITYKLVITENGNEVFNTPLGFESISAIVSDYPDEEESNQFFKLVANHPSASVRAQVAGKNNLNNEVVSILTKDQSLNVLRCLSYSDAFPRVASEETIESMINLNDEELSSRIASDLDKFVEIERDRISLLLAKAPDPGIRRSLAFNSSISKKILKTLLKDDDILVSQAAKYSLG